MRDQALRRLRPAETTLTVRSQQEPHYKGLMQAISSVSTPIMLHFYPDTLNQSQTLIWKLNHCALKGSVHLRIKMS